MCLWKIGIFVRLFRLLHILTTYLLRILAETCRGIAAGRVSSQRMRLVGSSLSQLVSPASASAMAASNTAHTLSGTELSLAI
jgi:hypothetical protein